MSADCDFKTSCRPDEWQFGTRGKGKLAAATSVRGIRRCPACNKRLQLRARYHGEQWGPQDLEWWEIPPHRAKRKEKKRNPGRGRDR